MMNPANIMKIMNAKNKFTANHPKFVAFLSAVFSREMEEGTVIEITLTRPGKYLWKKTSAHAKIFLRKNTKIYT